MFVTTSLDTCQFWSSFYTIWQEQLVLKTAVSHFSRMLSLLNSPEFARIYETSSSVIQSFASEYAVLVIIEWK